MTRTVLGIVACDLVANVERELVAWKAELGYRLALVVVRFDEQAVEVVFDGAQHPMRLDDGTQITPIGLAVCFNDGFRGAPGQKLPLFLSSSSMHVAVTTGNCFGFVYAFDGIREPAAVRFEGAWTGPLPMLPVSGAVGTGVPPSMGLSFPQGAAVRGHVPYCDPMEVPAGFWFFKPAGAQCGIRALGAHDGIGIVSIRLPQDEARRIGPIQREDVRLELRDGTTLESTGLLISTHGLAAPEQLAEYPVGVMDKGSVGPGSVSLFGHGTVRFLRDYRGPRCGYSNEDCKIVAAFDRVVAWEELDTAIVGAYLAPQLPDTVPHVAVDLVERP